MSIQVSHSCTSCFNTTKYPGIKIGEDGRCTFCNAHPLKTNQYAITTSDLTTLQHIADKLRRGKTKKYDCIIGASGGLDSSYLIYLAKKKLNLNPLIISYDHGFTYDHAKDNLKILCDNLNVDFKIIKSAEQNDRKYVRSIVLAMKNMDVYWGICSFCHYILQAVVYKYALKESIPAILSSSNIYEEGLSLTALFRLKFILKKFFNTNILTMPGTIFYLALARYYLLKLKLEFYIPPAGNLLRQSPKRPPIQGINVTRYVKWDVLHMIKTLEDETGWKLTEHPNILMRFDCKIEDSFLNDTYKKATGLTLHAIVANNLIHADIQTKSQLKEAVEYYDNVIRGRKDELMHDLGLIRH